MRLDVIDSLLDCSDFFSFLVRDFGLEFFLERHDQFHRVERIGAEVVDERRLGFDVGFVHTQLFGNNFFDPLLDIFP